PSEPRTIGLCTDGRGGSLSRFPKGDWQGVQFDKTVPTVLDRFIQQALLQVLQPLFDPTFSDASYGFRPGRSAHDAVRRAQAYVQEGRSFVVDMTWRSSSTGSTTTS